MSRVHTASHVSLAAKIEFLRDPGSHLDRPAAVDTIETHFAWLFLSRKFVYKLKKPIRFRSVDFTHLETRRAICELEVNLNRRLAESTYIGAIPLTYSSGRLQLKGDGRPVEWLVKMHRLPAEQSLELACQREQVPTAQLKELVVKLVRFYAQAMPAHWDEDAYLRRLREALDRYGAQLSAPALGLDSTALKQLAQLQRAFLADKADLLKARIAQGRVVDAHGDLRPEHIFLLPDPQIIDCLEFSSELRLLDAAEEIAFLALECERLGCKAIGEQIGVLYREIAADPLPVEVMHFYRSMRAMIRALLSAWHLEESGQGDTRVWVDRAHWYLEIAQRSLAEPACATPKS